MSRSRNNKKNEARAAPAPQPSAPSGQGEADKTKKSGRNLARHSVILFWFTAVALLAIFAGRWIYAINEGYFNSFIRLDASMEQAAANMTGLDPTAAEDDQLLPLQREWDLFTSSRLRDEVTLTARDGTVLHGCLYDEGSDVTAVFLPRFYEDGTADFLPGAWLNERTGCNILLIDPRCHGESGGEYFGFGVLEQYDLADWLAWADETLGAQTFLLWGEGTGANTILHAAAGGLLPESAVFAVAESPYASLHELASTNIWKWYKVPAFPFLNVIEWTLSRSEAGYAVGDADLAALLPDSGADLPVLFLQSAGDDYILPEWTRETYDAYPGPKEFFSGGYSHGTVYAAGREEIQTLLGGWLDELA